MRAVPGGGRATGETSRRRLGGERPRPPGHGRIARRCRGAAIASGPRRDLSWLQGGGMRALTVRGIGLLGFAAAVGLIAVAAWGSYRAVGNLRDATLDVRHTLRVREQAE